MINEKRMYGPGEVAEIAKAYRAMVFKFENFNNGEYEK
jgi:hypothetical protein|tara:strand:+ start:1218 stop:1331 length:114 start_codon:yes stop_codon:yes gene_type:complete